MLTQTSSSLLAYVTSDFEKHGLLATTQIMANLIGGVSRLPIAKIIDVWGRPEGLIIMTIITTLSESNEESASIITELRTDL